jgi:hypothetical protein
MILGRVIAGIVGAMAVWMFGLLIASTVLRRRLAKMAAECNPEAPCAPGVKSCQGTKLSARSFFSTTKGAKVAKGNHGGHGGHGGGHK